MGVEIVSLGCRLNLAEGARLQALLGGTTATPTVVINSCAVTAEALRDTRRAIRRARRQQPGARLIVTGCAATIDRDGLAAMPEVDGLIANDAKLDPRAWGLPDTPLPASLLADPLPTRTRAFVIVQNGCDHACSFCVIPRGRGASRSRAAEEVITEIAALVRAGVKEVVLTGVDLTAWGLDLPVDGAHPPRLGTLVGAILDQCPGLARLRLSSLDSAEIDDELRARFGQEARLMPQLHLSLQHGADLILKRMKRRHLSHDAIALVEDLRARRPTITIGADLIAGFPTETAAHHAENMATIARLGIVHLHAFRFSAHPETPAARMPQLDAATIAARAAELREAGAQIRARWLKSLIGTPLRVLAERDGIGHAENFAPVRLPAGTPACTLLTLTPTHLIEGVLA